LNRTEGEREREREREGEGEGASPFTLGRGGVARQLAACHVYLLARHRSNRLALGAAGAVELLLVLLHESMQGAATSALLRRRATEETRRSVEARIRRWVRDDAQEVSSPPVEC
jgi:hypothetical protein